MTDEDKIRLANALESKKHEDLWQRISEPVAEWERGPLKWMTAHTFTEDSHALAKGTPWKERFPRKDYIKFFMSLLLSESALLVSKSREVMASWTVMAYLAWMCITKPTFAICQSANETKSSELIDYARILYRNQEPWLKRRNNLVVDNSLELRWEQGGRLLAVPSGEHQVRMFHPNVAFFDEAAFIPEWQASYDAVRPVAKQMISVSTDEIGAFHNLCKLEDETREA